MRPGNCTPWLDYVETHKSSSFVSFTILGICFFIIFADFLLSALIFFDVKLRKQVKAIIVL